MPLETASSALRRTLFPPPRAYLRQDVAALKDRNHHAKAVWESSVGLRVAIASDPSTNEFVIDSASGTTIRVGAAMVPPVTMKTTTGLVSANAAGATKRGRPTVWILYRYARNIPSPVLAIRAFKGPGSHRTRNYTCRGAFAQRLTGARISQVRPRM